MITRRGLGFHTLRWLAKTMPRQGRGSRACCWWLDVSLVACGLGLHMPFRAPGGLYVARPPLPARTLPAPIPSTWLVRWATGTRWRG